MPPMEEYIDEIRDIWDSRWMTNMGIKHQELQKELKEYLGVENIDLLDGDLRAVGMHSDVTPNLMGMASPAAIASMAAFLLDDSSAYTTGRNFYVDGGRL